MEKSEFSKLKERELQLLEELKKIRKLKGKKSQEQLTFPSNQKRTHSPEFSGAVPYKQTKLTTYEKLPGIVNYGKEYEILTNALYALKLTTCDDVIDFDLTASNKEYGYFDDIGLKVTFKDGKKHTFLFQLKHRENAKVINQQDLIIKQKKNDFYLEKYFKSLSEITAENATCILYTNCSTNIETSNQTVSNDIIVESCSQLEHCDLLLNSEEKSSILQFTSKNSNQSLYFFTRQKNIQEVRVSIKEILETLLQTDIYSSFIHYMSEWWSGTFILTKHIFIAKLSELALSPYIKTLSNTKSNEKSANLVQAIEEFELTIVQSDDEIVENIWTNDFEEDDNVIHAFGLSNESSSVQKSKVLWHLNKAPLVVSTNESNLPTVKSVMKLLSLVEKKRIILVGVLSRQDFDDWIIFENLFDLKKCKNEEFYQKIVSNFRVSLQNRNSISLEELIEVDSEIFGIITTTELLRMSQIDLVIGSEYDKLGPWHIPRNLSTRFIHLDEILEEFYPECTIIINCKQLDIKTIELFDYLNGTTEDSIIVSPEKCSSLQFRQVCEVSKKPNVYLFQLCEDNWCRLLLKQEETPEDSSISKKIKQEHIFENFDNPLNIICALPGMGKSTLMKKLSTSCPPTTWAVYFDLIHYNSLLSTNSSHEALWSRLLELDQEQDPLVLQIKLIFWRKKKMHVFFDGLHEVDSKYVSMVLEFVKSISCEGANVWLSARENLREKISKILNVVPIEIEELSHEEQEKYVREKLKQKFQEEEILKIMKAAFDSVDVNNSRELLGIPLHLHIITEMYLRFEEAFKDFQKKSVLILTELYKIFFEGKKMFTDQKIGLGGHVELQRGYYFQHHLEQYEIPALKFCLSEEDFKKLELKESKSFIKSIKENGDKFGIIMRVDENDEAVFSHRSFAEYFAAVWFRKNLRKVKILGDKLFSPRYQSLRVIFDVMLAEKNQLHLSIIYKNKELFNNNLEEVNERDLGGRTALHLACCYHNEILDKLVQNEEDLENWDYLFNFSCLDYSIRSKNLYSIEKMLENGLVSFDQLSATIFTFHTVKNIVENCIFSNHPNLLSEILKQKPESLNQEMVTKYLETRKEDDQILEILFNSHISLPRKNTILHEAAKSGTITKDLIKTAKKHDIDINQRNEDGRTILHLYALSQKTDKKTLDLLISNIKDINSCDKNGSTALHLASRSGKVEMAIKLIENKIDVNILDYKGNNALHYALLLKRNSAIINLLLFNGIDIQISNKNGKTPFLVACENGNFEAGLDLISRGCDVDSVDDDGSNALHYICQNREENTVIFDLLNERVDINARNGCGMSPLQLACENGHVELARKLMEKGADFNLCDNGNSILHFVAQSITTTSEVIDILFDSDLDVNFQNWDGATPLHFACEVGNFEIVKKLMELGADCSLLDKKMNSALHYSMNSWKANLEVMDLLTEAGVDVNVRNYEGTTALHLACRKGCVESIERLVKNGAVMDLDRKGNSALDYSYQLGSANENVLDVLARYGPTCTLKQELL